MDTMEVPQQAPAKKPKTPGQQRAIDAMRAAADQKAYQRIVDQQKAAAPAPAVSAPVPEAAEPVVHAPAAVHEHVQQQYMPPPGAVQQRQQLQQSAYADDEGDSDVDFVDADELMSTLHETREQLASLQERFDGLHSSHEELNTSFRQHNIRKANELNFV